MNKYLPYLYRAFAVLLIGILLRVSPQAHVVMKDYRELETAYTAGDLRTVSLTLQDLAARLPWRTELWEKAGEFAAAAEETQLAQTAFEKALSRSDLSESGKLALADMYDQAGDKEAAQNLWADLENNPEALFRLANAYFEQNDIPAAIETWQALNELEVESGSYPVDRKLSLLLAAHDPEQALPYLKDAVQDHPSLQNLLDALEEALPDQEPAYVYVISGQKLASLGRWTLAEHAFQQAVANRDDYGEAWAYLAEAQQHLPERKQDPLPLLEKALDLSPDSPAVNTFAGLYWRRQGEYETALTYFETTAELAPNLPEVYIEIGKTLAVLGELDAALGQYNQAIEIASEKCAYQCELARFTLEFNYQVRETGLPAARRALLLNENNPQALNTMGEVLFALEDEASAKKFFYQALEADPAYTLAHLNLGRIFVHENDSQRAEYHFNKILAISMDEALIRQAQSFLSMLSEQ